MPVSYGCDYFRVSLLGRHSCRMKHQSVLWAVRRFVLEAALGNDWLALSGLQLLHPSQS